MIFEILLRSRLKLRCITGGIISLYSFLLREDFLIRFTQMSLLVICSRKVRLTLFELNRPLAIFYYRSRDKQRVHLVERFQRFRV